MKKIKRCELCDSEIEGNIERRLDDMVVCEDCYIIESNEA